MNDWEDCLKLLDRMAHVAGVAGKVARPLDEKMLMQKLEKEIQSMRRTLLLAHYCYEDAVKLADGAKICGECGGVVVG